MKDTILIVDDEEINRRLLARMLQSDYQIIEAADGKEALEVLQKDQDQIAAVILDLIMPVMSGYDFLERYHQSQQLQNIPVIVSTGDDYADSESKCLEMGAWDFIRKPFNVKIIRFRVKNAIERSQMQIMKKMQYMEEYDDLTGLYRKNKFFKKTRQMIDQYSNCKYIFIHFDVAKFQLVNAFFGMEKGDEFLCKIADKIREYAAQKEHITYARIRADVFVMCMEYRDEQEMLDLTQMFRDYIGVILPDFDMIPVFGFYYMKNLKMDINEMYDHAKLAARICKGNYIQNYAYYRDEMSQDIINEQKIVNMTRPALKQEQFILYLQPKYDLRTNCIAGAEVLVRWKDPERGMISPGEFIPIFERNGFIMKLDYYVWEHACQLLRKWLDQGYKPLPVSVNVSRVSVYNPKLVDIICELVSKYQIPPELFELELTESAYTSNPVEIREAMAKLQKKGFTILMDDFGSGYSSLNVLKDIAVDILKIDMKFMDNTEIPGRGENILASVVRMAKWLEMPVIAEGVEKASQVEFLKSIGCEYVQGFYFARPMPVEEYEQTAFLQREEQNKKSLASHEGKDQLWSMGSQMELMFSNMQQAIAIYEYHEDRLDLIRVNNAYYDLFGHADLEGSGRGAEYWIEDAFWPDVKNAFEKVAKNQHTASCECVRRIGEDKKVWIRMDLKYISEVGDRYIVFGTLTDITQQKQMVLELNKYRRAISSATRKDYRMLIVDDLKISREMLKKIFRKDFRIQEAANGKEALEILKKDSEIDLILMDLWMPVMDGHEFMKYYNNDPVLKHIPIIVITSDDSTEQQVDIMAMGANDYIVKPFVPEVVSQRVWNVLEFRKRFGETLLNYETGQE